MAGQSSIWFSVIATAAVTAGLMEAYYRYSAKEVTTTKPKSKKVPTEYPEELIREQLSRNYSFLTEEGMQKVRKQNVVVVGAGGVGSWVVMMLVRSGVENVRVIDFDQVTLSSLNRNASAMLADVGSPKVDCIKKQLLQIAPWAKIDAINQLWNMDSAEELIYGGDFNPTYVVDAIDNMETKIDLLTFCHRKGLKVISSGGASCKSDPSRINVADISKTDEDPLSKQVRVRLKKRGIFSDIHVVFSTEKPDPRKAKLLPLSQEEYEKGQVEQLAALQNFRVRILPVLGTLPAMFGLVIATHIITSVSGYPMEPILLKNRFHLYNDLIQSLAGQLARTGHKDNRVPVTPADVNYILEELFRGKSPISGITTRLTLCHWDPSKDLEVLNIVVMTKEEQKNHEVRVLKGGEKLEDVYLEKVLENVAKAAREDAYYKQFR